MAEFRPAGAPADDTAGGRSAELRDALGTLRCEQREVLILRLLCGYSTHEVADRVGHSAAGVYGLQHRARRALRSELARTGAAPATVRRA